jgi:hypothetical protein
MRRMGRLSLFLASVGLLMGQAPGAAAPQAQTGQVRGMVADVRGGERLGRVRLRLLPVAAPSREALEAITTASGEFAMSEVPAGEYELIVSTVGYRLFRQKLTIQAGDRLEMEIALSPEAFTQKETVEVHERVFEPLDTLAASQQTLSHSEVKNLGSVLADDPLRAVQAMPGVSVGDDFESRFSLHGASFRNIGIYLDGALLHAPFHTVHTQEGATGSMTMLSGDQVDSISLLSSGFSAKYGDRTAGALVIDSREGGRLRPTARITASASNAGVLAEGPLTPSHKGSWLLAFRKSYLDYIIRRMSADASIAFGFLDGQSHLVYDFGPRYQVSLSTSSGSSALDRSSYINKLGLNSVMQSDSVLLLGDLGFRYLSGPRFLLTAHVSEMRETFRDTNKETTALESGRYQETATRTDATWYWAAGQPLEFGEVLRKVNDQGVQSQALASHRYTELARYTGGGWTTAGYFQQTLNWHGLRFGGGIRWDAFSPTGEITVSPRLSLAVPLPAGQSLQFGWGEYSQFPEQQMLRGMGGNRALSAERSTHMVAAWEWLVRERTRLRVEVYDREDRNGIYRPFGDARLLLNGKIFAPARNALWENSLYGHARGAEILLQRRSANRLTGWISYSYQMGGLTDSATGLRFPYDEDQKHTFNVYSSYRIRPSVNLSGKWVVGSGYRIPGFLKKNGPNVTFSNSYNQSFSLTVDRNQLKLDAFERLDLRLNKSFHTARRRFTMYAEVINVQNRHNWRFSELASYNTRTAACDVRFDRMFPIIPSAGLVFEF